MTTALSNKEEHHVSLESMDSDQVKKVLKQSAGLFQALSSPYRLKILLLLKSKEMDVHHLQEALEISQPLVSQHLKVLKNCGLLLESKQGRHVFYKLRSSKINKVLMGLFQLQALELTADAELLNSLNEMMTFWTL